MTIFERSLPHWKAGKLAVCDAFEQAAPTIPFNELRLCAGCYAEVLADLGTDAEEQMARRADQLVQEAVALDAAGDILLAGVERDLDAARRHVLTDAHWRDEFQKALVEMISREQKGKVN